MSISFSLDALIVGISIIVAASILRSDEHTLWGHLYRALNPSVFVKGFFFVFPKLKSKSNNKDD
ncbi:MAG: hypothetical protein HOA14_00170 [Planctomycetaceae bacterium]|nr:hypothetical protein [Planctomycetaceae bacterium]MBT4013156.1 hypothetical protein [Planctomycetaceae bacterium]MBT4725394.1 hypothetical protein [Planctomycetaceae bacterium]MBT5123235.1 hypothetical protein [Planctomycetaceae bacterium]MBT5597683.1 hypothetical protein [Planctomycetaceae bacterium]